MNRMRIALTTGVLQVPPTYFALNHAQRLISEHDFRMFTLAADIQDPAIRVPVQDFVPARSLPFAQRKYLAPFAMPAMAPAIKRFEPDVIHQHFATWSKPAVDASISADIPLITTLHGYDVRAMLRKARTPIDRWHQRNVRMVQMRGNRFLAVGKYLASLAVEAGFDPNRLEVHYLGVDTDFFTPQEQRPLDSEPPIVLFVGALSELKGVRDLVKASRQILARAEHQLVFIGDGPLRAELQAETMNDRHVQILGRLDRDRIREWYARARVMVLPTQEYKGSREATGTVLMEAQSCGTPVVAYDTGGTSEMMIAGNTGLLAPEKDVFALGRAIEDVVSLDAANYMKMSARARMFIVADRSLRGSSEQLLEHYSAIS